MIPVRAIADELAQDSVIASLVDDRVFDRDLRRAGHGAINAIFTPMGEVMPSLMVDDAGGGRNPASRSATVFQDRCYVWIFVPRTDAGFDAGRVLTERVIAVLQRWQDTETGIMMFYSDRVGLQETAAPSDSYMDRVTFTANGVVRGTRW